MNVETFKALPDRRLNLFRVVPGGKTPAVREWQRVATCNWEGLAWVHTGNYNAGVFTGKFGVDRQLLVLDLDRKNGKDGVALLDAMYPDLPPTFEVDTPTGGKHLYFTTKKRAISKADVLGPGIDVKSTGGYVVAPGSKTPDGRYTIAVDAEIAEAPKWLEDLIPEAGAKLEGGLQPCIELDQDFAIDRAVAVLMRAEPAIEGASGDTQTFRVACKVKDEGVAEHTCLALMTEHFNPRCSPPWEPEALEAKVASAYRNSQEAPGSKSPLRGLETDWPTPLSGAETPKSGEDPFDPPAKPIRELPILAFRECQPDLFRIDLIKGVLGREGLSVLYGDSNVGKTFVALDLAFHVATGKPWRGRRVEQGVVVYVAAEGGNGIRNRIAALKIKHGVEDADLFVIPASVDMLRPDADCGAIIDAIRKIEALTGKKVKFVVIDTLSRALAGGNENDSTDMGSFVRNCDRLRHAAKTHLMVVHHNGKDAAKGARGHSSLRAAIDTEIEVADGVISFVKQRDMEAGAPVGFQLEIVELGTDAYGESVSSCVVGQAAVATEEERAAEVRISPQAKTLFRVFKEMWEDGEGGELNFISVDKWCLGVVKRRQNGDEALVSLPSEKKLLKQAIRRACLKLVEAKLLKNIVEDQWFM